MRQMPLKIMLLAFFLLLSMTGGSHAKEYLRIGVSQFPSTMHPAIDSMMAKAYVLGAVRRKMTIYDPQWRLQCVLCTEIPSFDNGRVKRIENKQGEPALAVRFTIKQEARWGDGTDLTSADVVFSFEAGKHPLSGFTNAAFLSENIEEVRALDEKNFVIHYKKEFCDYANLNDFEILPAHLERPIFEANPADYKNETLYDRGSDSKGLYNGPYIIDNVRKGRYVDLKRNPHWWGERPVFERVRIEAVENTSALSARLLAGQLDMIAGEIGLSLDQAVSFEKRLKARNRPYEVRYQSGLIYEHLDMNMDMAIFQDKTIRQALLHALNREAIETQLFAGKQKVAHSSVHPMDLFHDAGVLRYDYNPERAEELLEEAGWRYDQDGFRHNEKGERLGFTLYTTAGNKTREIVAQAIQSDWRAVGIDVSIQTLPPRVLFGQTLRQRNYDGVAMFAWLSAPDSVPKTTLHSTMIPAADNGYAGQNFTGYKNAEMDGLIDALETSCAPKPRAELWSNLQHLYANDLPALPLYFRANAFVIPKALKNLTPTGHQYATTHWIEHWDWQE